MRKFPFLFMLCLSTAFSQEQAPIQSTVAPTLMRAEELSLRPTDTQYPSELSVAGVQGDTEVLATFGDDGKLSSASIAKTSRSDKLDLAAVALVKSLSYSVKAQPLGSPPRQALIPVQFLRDSVSTLPLKLCKEFNIDLAYFKSTFPEMEPQKMTVVSMAIGYLALSGKPSFEKQVALAKSLKEIVPMTVSACASQPDAKFFEIFQNTVNEFSSKSSG